MLPDKKLENHLKISAIQDNFLLVHNSRSLVYELNNRFNCNFPIQRKRSDTADKPTQIMMLAYSPQTDPNEKFEKYLDKFSRVFKFR